MSEVIKKKPRGAPKEYLWKKGQSGNPSGANKWPEDIRKAAKLNKKTTVELLNKFLFMDRQDLSNLMQDPKTPLVELILGKVVEKAIQFGDHRRLEFLLLRLVGPVKTEQSALPPPTLVKLIGQDAVLAIGQQRENQDDEDN